jgi:hypothetical protein
VRLPAKKPRENRGALRKRRRNGRFHTRCWSVRSALGQFLATSGFGVSGPQILKLMRPQTSSPVSSNHAWTATGVANQAALGEGGEGEGVILWKQPQAKYTI